MKIEDLKNVSVNLDSDTARAIADQYIQFKYVEHFTALVVLIVLILAVGCGIKWVVKNS